MERGVHEVVTQLHLFDPAILTIGGAAKVLRPNFPNHFGEAEHDSFIDDLNHLKCRLFEFPEHPPFDPEDEAA